MVGHEVELRDTWRHVSGGGRTDPLERLLGRYREPHRRYHTTEHVVWVVRHVNQIASTDIDGNVPDDLPAVLLAALYHDAVYDPTATKAGNEIASAALAGACAASFGWSDERSSHVERLVFATADHSVFDVDSAVLIDADLAVLGGEPGVYAAYVRGVRDEYAHVPNDTWRSGRAAVLEGFLQRDAIFTTPFMHAQREARARANLTAELTTLSRG